MVSSVGRRHFGRECPSFALAQRGRRRDSRLLTSTKETIVSRDKAGKGRGEKTGKKADNRKKSTLAFPLQLLNRRFLKFGDERVRPPNRSFVVFKTNRIDHSPSLSFENSNPLEFMRPRYAAECADVAQFCNVPLGFEPILHV